MSENNFAYTIQEHQDFSNCNLRNSTFLAARLDHVNFAHADLRGSDFTGAEFRDVTITLNCKTFENIRLDKRTFKMLLYLMLKARISDDTLTLFEHDRMTEVVKGTCDPPKISQILTALIGEEDISRLDSLFESIEFEPAEYELVADGEN